MQSNVQTNKIEKFTSLQTLLHLLIFIAAPAVIINHAGLMTPA